MEDVQGRSDMRGIGIPAAGISDLRYPISVSVAGSVQHSVGTFRMSVSVPPKQKGTHMSRFVEEVQSFRGRELLSNIRALTTHVREHLDAERASVEVSFPFFLSRKAPVTGAEALLEYCGHLRASVSQADVAVEIGVKVPITTVCPCSKAISDYGAHNQRGIISICVHTATEVGLHELIDYAEASASCRLYPLVKRADERSITMAAYDHPQFVEDVVRDVSLFLQADVRISAYAIDVTNDESIHNHAAFASCSWTRSGAGMSVVQPLCTLERYG